MSLNRPIAKPKSVAREEVVIARQMHQALVLHFLEGLTQAQIADQLGISHATVNRLIKRGRQLGLVEIKIKSPVEPLVDMEEQLLALGDPQFTGNNAVHGRLLQRGPDFLDDCLLVERANSNSTYLQRCSSVSTAACRSWRALAITKAPWMTAWR